MSLQIWKYKIDVGINIIEMPRLIKVCQGAYSRSDDEMYIWCMIDTATQLSNKRINVIGTGFNVPDYNKYCGTIITPSAFVWHVFVPRNELAMRIK